LNKKMPRVGEKQAGRRSHLWAFTRLAMPEQSEEFHAELVKDMLGSEKQRADSEYKCVDEVFGHLDQDAKKDLKDLEMHLVEDKIRAQVQYLARKEHERATPGHSTPIELKALEPPVKAAFITWDLQADKFAAFYNGAPRPYSTSRSYKSGKQSRVQCLTVAVRFLWKKHAEMDGVGLFAFPSNAASLLHLLLFVHCCFHLSFLSLTTGPFVLEDMLGQPDDAAIREAFDIVEANAELLGAQGNCIDADSDDGSDGSGKGLGLINIYVFGLIVFLFKI
jgi:hypothetical protein